jgi:hypothetical protein
MLHALQVVTVISGSVAMALALAHALELPGKLRLTKEAYYAMQSIYYPGFHHRRALVRLVACSYQSSSYCSRRWDPRTFGLRWWPYLDLLACKRCIGYSRVP